jgi:hypothetical protein
MMLRPGAEEEEPCLCLLSLASARPPHSWLPRSLCSVQHGGTSFANRKYCHGNGGINQKMAIC